MKVSLYCDDCLNILSGMEANSVDAIITDPPYGLDFPYLTYKDTRENLMFLISKFVPECQRISNRFFVLCGPTQITLYPQPDWIMIVTWNTTGSFGKYGYNQWTPILCYGKDLKGFGNINGILKTDTLKISGGGGVGFMRSALEKQHTCPKPMTMMNLVVRRLTSESDVILDPFMGSGSTGVACISQKRSFIGIEIDPDYYAIAKRRIEEAQAEVLQ